ncbi:tetratricopeptide repeat protein [Microbacterium oryzae]|uniref:tetratricopeptide repeat protein n=1 Tax=Microbacterium oryzae TaxID=743009 RepID=UPI0025AF3C1B|nr:tetratricopeptide repeat protein [Microbacterium oryzae]MDN3311842.1 tetratricopeptide repeat protein [Microbacterium oryzae]
MRARAGVALMALLLLLYIVLVAQRAIGALGIGIGTGQPILAVMGGAMIVLPLIAIWALGRELVFGWRAERLARRLEREGGLPTEVVTTSPSGRIGRADGDALFPTYRAQVEKDETDWRAWYRLSLAYSAAGDTKRARSAAREAIRLERSQTTS